ncbi:MAG: hypothetical protein AAF564_24240 [Bacteroidota bacterium]
MSYSAISVWVVDPDVIRSREISSLINETVDIRCIRCFDDMAAVQTQVISPTSTQWPDVALVFGPVDGEESEYLDIMIGIKLLKQQHPDLTCLYVDGADSRLHMIEAIHAGAHGVVVGYQPYVKFIKTIRRAVAGGLWMQPPLAKYAAHVFADQAFKAEADMMLPIQTDLLLAFMADGVSEQEALDVLQLSRRHILDFLRQIYAALHRFAGIQFVA